MENVKIEDLYIIGYGLGGGFGGAQNYHVIEAKSLDKASEAAWEAACEEYQTYEGMHGLRDTGMIMKEDNVNEEEAENIYEEERDSWLDYSAVQYSKEYEAKVKKYHYQNDYKSITD